MSTVTQTAREAGEEAVHLIGQYPLPSALSAFGAGLGLGLLAVALLPNTSHERDVAITKRVFDVLSGILPDSIMKRVS